MWIYGCTTYTGRNNPSIHYTYYTVPSYPHFGTYTVHTTNQYYEAAHYDYYFYCVMMMTTTTMMMVLAVGDHSFV